jgi:hypothetical protein
MAVTFDEIDQMFRGFGAVDFIARTPYRGCKVNVRVPVEFTLTIELMPYGPNMDQHLNLETPKQVRMFMYDMVEQIIDLVDEHYKITDAPSIDIDGCFHWIRWPTDHFIMTTCRVTIEFMEKSEMCQPCS